MWCGGDASNCAFVWCGLLAMTSAKVILLMSFCALAQAREGELWMSGRVVPG